ncbi:MAG TPA: hypothetical protein HA256_07320 [Methanoregulaceae archaeon]|jgi:hypothetical protein|nr:hypothetical protein [Methanoregulaceae archaeon]
MERNHKILLGAVLAITIILFFVNIYAAGTAAIIFIALVMSVWIMQDSQLHPEIVATLRNEAKSLELRNQGNATAYALHVVIIPHDVELDIPMLGEEERYVYTFDKMVDEAKVVVSFTNEKKQQYKKTFLLSALGKSEDDLLKPMFPLFKWKKEDD